MSRTVVQAVIRAKVAGARCCTPLRVDVLHFRLERGDLLLRLGVSGDEEVEFPLDLFDVHDGLALYELDLAFEMLGELLVDDLESGGDNRLDVVDGGDRAHPA